ncbi:sulfide/dihydroorotate dehydrogenase-like FAD/NAD-binding protein [Syntrophotalea acetylenica]|jgi:ferredoxin--NADP+ reductase|uniref:Ferredoxin-NADP reductase n=1 Tax=Syntrophotalea acetylenica TaxID=29542 RepID=A0A1L3GE82_SYNAC|nr:sulfide/dihydroorotate dehydrogenase-like FAD/NAD-binding protein [Syntrophotalea acetylenica]APG24217.1 ferredoxin-NADP reductase [Syntrophotalea acetylenica]APG44797.1 ferredoxin-NADP reductase [Syntrophotalea acetylenica]MDY0261822.1 sulfide/dihydroorotate dehydrogenase-like FAD/NAD-binding protein [Syntrophotalea acetylenica]
MFRILANTPVTSNLHRLDISAPRIASHRKPGQFVIVHAEEDAERIPLTIADADQRQGSITLFVQAVGYSTRRLVAMPAGASLRDVAGPLGRPTHIERWGRVTCAGGGVGTAVLYPVAKALAAAGNRVTTLIGGRTASLIIMAEEFSAFCEKVLITTEDGSLGQEGLVTTVLDAQLRAEESRPQAVFAAGPVPMMRAVAEMTRPWKVHTIVSLNPIMIDGTGMCGGCRVMVNGEMKFACVDGPEFDGHMVDFDLLADRLTTYRDQECRMLKKLEE